jgi:hypothetical protein
MDPDASSNHVKQLPPLNAEHVYVTASNVVASVVPAAPCKETSSPVTHLAMAASCVEVATWAAMQRFK